MFIVYRFSSLNETFVVEDSPVTGIEFVQVKADLVGSVNFGTDFDHAITISMRDVSKNNIVGRATTNKGNYNLHVRIHEMSIY